MSVMVHINFKRLNKENDDETAYMLKKFEENVFPKLKQEHCKLIISDEKKKLEFFNSFDMLSFRNFDRLYYIYYNQKKLSLDEPVYGDEFYLVGRMNIDGKCIFIETRGYRIDEIFIGYFFLSVDANVFLKALIGETIFKTLRQCLVDDGIKLNDDSHKEYIEYLKKIKNNESPFQNIRHLGFIGLRNTLIRYKDYLPEYLRDKIDDFIDFQLIRNEYTSFQDYIFSRYWSDSQKRRYMT